MLLLTKPTTCRKKEIGVKTAGQQQRMECKKVVGRKIKEKENWYKNRNT